MQFFKNILITSHFFGHFTVHIDSSFFYLMAELPSRAILLLFFFFKGGVLLNFKVKIISKDKKLIFKI